MLDHAGKMLLSCLEGWPSLVESGFPMNRCRELLFSFQNIRNHDPILQSVPYDPRRFLSQELKANARC